MIDVMMSPENRLKDWKSFRQTLEDLELEEQLHKIAEYWSKVPLITYYLDFDDPENWPTPWELIHEGEFCKSGVAYLMKSTLELIKKHEWQTGDLKLMLINDLLNSEIYIVLLVHNTYILNYNHSEVENWKKIENNCKIYCEY